MIKRLAITSLLVILLVLGGGYWTWPYWSTGLLRAIVAGYDLDLSRADIARPGLTSISIKSLDVRYSGTAVGARVQAPLVTLTYQPAELLRGRLEAIEMPGAAIDVQPSPADNNNQREKSAQTSLPIALPESLFAKSPVAHLQFDRLIISSPFLAEHPIVNGAVQMNRDELAITLDSPGPAALDFTLAISRQNSITAELKIDKELAIQLNGDVTGSDGHHQIAGQLNVALGATSKLLQPFAPVPVDADISGQLQADWQMSIPSSVNNAALQQLRVEGQLASSGTVEFAGILDAGRFSLGSSFQLSNDHSHLEVSQLSLSGTRPAPAALLEANKAFAGKPLEVELAVEPGTQVAFDHATSQFSVNSLAGRLAINHAGGGLESTVKFDGAELTASDTLQGRANFTTSANLARVSSPEYSAEQLQLTTGGELSIASGQVTINPLGPINIKAINANINNYLLDTIKVTCDNISGIVIDQHGAAIAQATLFVNDQTITDAPLRIAFPRAIVELQEASLSFVEEPRLAANMAVSVAAVAISQNAIQLLPIDVNANLELKENRLNGTFAAANINQLLSTRGEVKHDLLSGEGQLTANMDSAVLSKQTAYLSRIFVTLAEPVDVTNGQFHVTAKASWDATQTGIDAEIVLENIGGFYKRNLFNGLNGTLRLRSDAAGATVAAEHIKITEANVGIKVKNIRFGLAPRNSAIVATNFRAELLGGEISQKEFSYDWARAENQLVINLHDIQLGEVLKLERGIVGTGSIGGQLPITFADSGISVKRGGISAQAPGGVLKYDSGTPLSGAAANAGLQLTFDALKNFHYSVLTAQVEYATSGDLTLKVTLQGRNPDLKQQRPFLFNLNISENIPTLLKSLQLTQEISDDLDRRIKAFYKTDSQETLQ